MTRISRGTILRSSWKISRISRKRSISPAVLPRPGPSPGRRSTAWSTRSWTRSWRGGAARGLGKAGKNSGSDSSGSLRPLLPERLQHLSARLGDGAVVSVLFFRGRRLLEASGAQHRRRQRLHHLLAPLAAREQVDDHGARLS